VRSPSGKWPTRRQTRTNPPWLTLATGDEEGIVRFWDAATGKERPGSARDWKIGKIGALAFSPDGFTCIAGGEGRLVVWDLESADLAGLGK
jgi:WD40 repeat protein